MYRAPSSWLAEVLSTSLARRGNTPRCGHRRGTDGEERRSACAVPRAPRAGHQGAPRCRPAGCVSFPLAFLPPKRGPYRGYTQSRAVCRMSVILRPKTVRSTARYFDGHRSNDGTSGGIATFPQMDGLHLVAGRRGQHLLCSGFVVDAEDLLEPAPS